MTNKVFPVGKLRLDWLDLAPGMNHALVLRYYLTVADSKPFLKQPFVSLLLYKTYLLAPQNTAGCETATLLRRGFCVLYKEGVPLESIKLLNHYLGVLPRDV